MKLFRTAHPKRPGISGAGFTLLEVILAAAVLAIVIALLGSMAGSVTHLSSQAAARLDAVRLGREIFDLMGRDFSQTVISKPALGSGPSVPLQFCVNPAQVSAECLNATAIFWQSSVARSQASGTSQGNVAVVGYFVQKIATNRAQLRRVLIEPTDTLYQVYSAPGNWLPASTLAKFTAVSGGTASNQADRGWAADGVIGLWVRCLDANGAVITQNGARTTQNYAFDSRLGISSNSFLYTGFNALPSFVDVGLVCVAPKDVDRIVQLPPVTAASPVNFETEMANYVAAVSAQNPRVKTVTSLTRRFRIYGVN